MITIKLIGESYYSVSPDYVPVFGTDTIPTPYTKVASLAFVIARIKALNPGKVINVA
jgi:hypothetical protein